MTKIFLFGIWEKWAFGERGWSVKYKHSNICALKGSSVFIHSNYTHPSGLTGVKKFWAKNPSNGVEPTDLTTVPGYTDRVQYSDNENQTFDLHLQTVNKSDEHMYCVRITTNQKGERYLGYPGVMLRVTGQLMVVVPERVSEGNATLLTCATTCNLTEKATFTWFKNGRLLQTNNQDLNTLYIQSTRIDDAARYCCAVKGYEHRCSPEVFLNVRYPPKNVSVSISPSGGIVEGSSVTLTCRGDAYPPVQNYTWFKVKAMVGQDSTFTISKISPEDSGEYKCKCINAEGVRYSAVVTLKVVAPPKSVSVSISPSGGIVEGSSVNLTCSSDANPPVQIHTWFKEGETSPVGFESDFSFIVNDTTSGRYFCEVQNGHGSLRSALMPVVLMGKIFLLSNWVATIKQTLSNSIATTNVANAVQNPSNY
uniref:Ig-like domain-containing protein n=1 Tax=Astyanax mexicanus TaxID=7994 RepID=A0A8B9HQQ6_ASTMX